MEIRIAAENDLPGLVMIQREVQELHARAHPTYYRRATDEELFQAVKDFLAAENTRVWIALADGKPAGSLVFRIDSVEENAFCYARKEAVVDQLAVLARFQRQGLGRALMTTATQHAISQACSELRLGVLASNAHALAFYDKLGFVAFLERMRKVL